MSGARSHPSIAILVGALLGAAAVRADEPPSGSSTPSGVQVLERAVEDLVEADGTSVRHERVRARILTAGGLAQYSQVGVAFLEANQEAKIDSLRVTKPDGSELDLLASAPSDVSSVFPTDLPIHSDLRVLRAAVPSLAIGDLIQFESSVRSKPIAAEQAWIEMKFAKPGVVELETYQIDTPLDARLTVSVRSGLSARLEEVRRDGRWLRKWTVKNVSETAAGGLSGPAGSAPAIASGEDTPDIQITTFKTWEEFGRWWSSLAPPKVDVAVSAKARELTAKVLEPEARLRALNKYVAQEIRYLALPLGIGRYRAREPSDVMSTGLGDCKDKFRLLASLAESLGIEVEPVLIFASAKRNFVEEAPSPLQFDHVVARARFGSKETWLDPTAELVPMGSLPKTSRGRPGVALRRIVKVARRGAGQVPEVEVELVTTPAHLPEPASVTVELLGTIDASGLLRAKVRWTVAGDDEFYRAIYKYGDERMRRSAFESLRREWSSDSKVGLVRTSEPNEVDLPFWLEYDVERSMPPSTWRKSWEFWVPTPFAGTNAPPDAAEDAAAGDARLERLEFQNSARQRVLARIELPEGVRVSPPVPMSSRRDFAEFRSDYRYEVRTLVLERELNFMTDGVPRAQFDELREFRRVIASDYQQEFDIAAAPDLAPTEHSAAELSSDCWDAIEGDRLAAAETLCRQAIALDPVQPNVWNRLGISLDRQGRSGEAKAAYEKQVEVDPRHEYAYANIGLLAWAAGDMANAESMLRKQVEISPLVAFGYGHLGRLLLVTGRFDEAESSLRRATKLDPSDSAAFEDLLELAARRGQFDAFAALLEEHPAIGRDLNRLASNLIWLAKQDTSGWRLLAGWLRGVAAEAESTLEPVDRPVPNREVIAAVAVLASAWEGLARVAYEEGHAADAVAFMDAAIELAHAASAVAGRSEMLRRSGEIAGANRMLAVAAELERPSRDDIHAMLVKAVPAPEARTELEVKARDEAWRFRSTTRTLLAAADEQGEIWALFGADGTLLLARPASESGTTKSLLAGLEKNPLALSVPPSNRARILVKILAYCSSSGECTLTIEPPGQTWMSMKPER